VDIGTRLCVAACRRCGCPGSRV